MIKKLLLSFLASFLLISTTNAGNLFWYQQVAASHRPIFYAPLTEDLTDDVSGVTATFSRASTATYTDPDDGKIHSAAINTARFETDGLLLEPAGTNYVINSHGESNDGTDWDDWTTVLENTTLSITSASDVFDSTDFPNVYWQRFQKTFDGAETNNYYLHRQLTANDSFAEDDPVTLSFYVKGSINFTSGKYLRVQLYGYDNSNSYTESIQTEVTVFEGTKTISLQRVTLSGVVSDAATKKVGVDIRFFTSLGPVSGDTMDVSITGIDVEKSPVATSYIPTVASTATRVTEAGNTYWPFASLNPAVSESLSGVVTVLVQATMAQLDTEVANYTLIGLFLTPMLMVYRSGNSLFSYDGTDNVRYNYSFVENTTYNLFVQGGYQDSGEKMRVGKYESGSFAFTEGAFDGSYNFGDNLLILKSLNGPTHIKNLAIFNRKTIDNQIANYFNNL